MDTPQWLETLIRIQALLSDLSITDQAGNILDTQSGFDTWLAMGQKVRRDRGVAYFMGNGASASMASHFSADLAKNGKIHTQVFSDPSLITAMGNDCGFEQIFSIPLSERATPRDMAVMISSSGESPNVLRAAEIAQQIGMQIVSITGKKPFNTLRKLGHLNLYVPASTYGDCESAHAVLLHHWMDTMEWSLREETTRAAWFMGQESQGVLMAKAS